MATSVDDQKLTAALANININDTDEGSNIRDKSLEDRVAAESLEDRVAAIDIREHSFENDYRKIVCIGEGSFGRVYLCQVRSTGRYVAIKILKKVRYLANL